MNTDLGPDPDIAAANGEHDLLHPGVVRVTHWLLVLSFVGLVVGGIAILVIHPRLYWGETGAFGAPSLVDLPLPYIRGHSGWGRHLHFLSAWVFVLSGLTYVVTGLLSRRFRKRLLPSKSQLSWRAITEVISGHLRWKRPHDDEAWSYNVVQRLTYLAVVFLLFPAMVWTGLAMSPAITSVVPFIVTVLGGHQSARTLHFVVANLLLVFVIVHVTLLFLIGFRSHVRAMITGYRQAAKAAETSPIVTRRKLITGGVATVAGVSGIGAAAQVASRFGLVPPDYAGLWGPSETLTYASQRLLTSQQSLTREFSRSDISRFAEVNGMPPEDDAYQRLLRASFADWRLSVGGLVARPRTFSLDEIQRLPAHSQITLHVCEEGWSFIAEWTGVRLSHVLELVGASPDARYVVFTPYDGWWGSLDMAHALHDQTFLAYGMNGRSLPTEHGAPLRLRVARQLGYVSIKYLSDITVTDSLDNFGQGLGSAAPEFGYSWYAGI